VIDQHFAILGGVIDLVATAQYARLTFLGRVRPNRVTWVIWAVAPLIGFAASLAAGVSWSAALTFAIGFGPLLVVMASLVRRSGYWELHRFDYACGALSVIALIGWAVSGSAALAIAFSVGADFLAALPTIRKAYIDPASEAATPYAGGVAAGVITTAAVPTWDFKHLAFPAYVTVVCVVITSVVLIRRARVPRP
jgi:hypothetical protein